MKKISLTILALVAVLMLASCGKAKKVSIAGSWGADSGSETVYLFNEDGYLVTGRMTREPGAAGYTGTQKTEWYFLESSKASLYSDSTGKAITPWTSNLGQQKMDRNYFPLL